ncbi:Chemotaxis protein CheY [Pelotomaculum sp. FP]|uniref:response regulator n=1 Tax=Pelotomaculum sp. FP TaxID=261474 RepID=UPI001103CB09|nr:response regulator [Pelotomaculum sp. FP]TEB15859.1 Chemotaxis protein CheY [Pelotomaculum sp. FP]
MGKRVLIINDKSLKRRLIRYALSKHGYEIVGEIRKGYEAVSLYNECRPDLVAIDISMHQYYQGAMVIFLIDSKARNIILEDTKNQDLNIKVLEPGEMDYEVKPPDDNQFLEAI